MNEADSEKMAAVLEKQGYQLARAASGADMVIINTCSVRESAENRVFGLVRNLTRRKRRGQKIILTGCMLGSALGERRRYRLGELKRRLPDVDEFKTIDELIGESKVASNRYSLNRPLVPIMRGCNHFCSYCVVPYARGEERSRPFDEIISEIEQLARRGYEEVLLLGQNVNSYQPSFAKLLRRLHRMSGLKKISFITSNPWDLTDEIIKAMTLPKIDRYLHLPVQSGDDQILRRMNRPYTAAQYLRLVKKIRHQIPEIKIGTDIIVGFPGETKKAFQNTVDLCKKVGFVKAYVSRYSPRPGTAAFKLKDSVSPVEKKRRWRILDKLINN
mgnify:CR=1 FL=1